MNGRQATPWTTIALYAIFGVVVAGALATLIGAVVVRFSCGVGGRPSSVFSGLQLAIGGDATGYAGINGCRIPVAPVRVLDLLALALIIAAAAAAAVWWFRFRRSDRYYLRELRRRDGFATAGELRRHTSARAALRRAKTLRPSREGPTPASAAWRVGSAHGRDVYLSIAHSLVVTGAPTAGSVRRFVAGAILDWDGPLVTTATRNDNLAATMRARAEVGEVTVFDPQQRSGIRSPLRISPVAGCEDPLIAERRARAIIACTAPGESTTDREQAGAASAVLARLLHAAAVSGRGTDALARWAANPRVALEAVEYLSSLGTPGWAEDLDAIVNGDERQLASAWSGVAGALRPLAIPAIRAAMTPPRGEHFDADRFLAAPNTLYLVGTGVGAGAAGGFLGAVLDDVVETARRKALASPGARLDPPLALILDELASMFPWPALPRTMTDGGGHGISTLVVLNDPARDESAWSTADADAVWSAADGKLVLGGGAGDAARLRDVESLLGTRRPGDAGRPSPAGARTEKVPVMTVDELRRMPETVGVLARSTHRGILLDLSGRPGRRAAADLASAARATELDQQGVFAEQYRASIDRRRAAQERS